jgi:hypothetical protein
MKNKRNALKLTLQVALVAMGMVILSSCSKSSDPINSEITQTVSNESTQDTQQDEVDDISSGQLNAVSNAGSRSATATIDGRIGCAYVHVTSDTANTKEIGSITIDFDKDSQGNDNASGCTFNGNTRKGSIIISWQNGRWFTAGSVITITLNNYSINGVVINGTRVLTNITTVPLKPSWTIVSTLTSTWPDASTAVRSVNKTRQWDIVGGTVTITQTAGADFAASGTNRYTKTYTVQITAGLVYDISCIASNKLYIPVSGTKIITVDTNKAITIDYGTGTCDDSITLTFDGKSVTITAKNDSSAD